MTESLYGLCSFWRAHLRKPGTTLNTKADEPLSRRSFLLAYFLLTFLISWSGAFAVIAGSLLHQRFISKGTGLIVFPAMLLGPCVSGVLLTWLSSKSEGLRSLSAGLRKWRVEPCWYALLLLPPMLVLAILYCLKIVVSSGFSPNHFYLGILFGIPAGIFEEIGWTGYAYPRMASKWSPLFGAVILGLLWSLWHLPAINFLGASAPHGAYWFRFLLAFGLAMTAMRVVICWLYSNTNSILLAQLMHISSTGSLVAFSPPVTPSQEAFWYAIYGGVLWVIAALIVAIDRRRLRREKRQPVGYAY